MMKGIENCIGHVLFWFLLSLPTVGFIKNTIELIYIPEK